MLGKSPLYSHICRPKRKESQGREIVNALQIRLKSQLPPDDVQKLRKTSLSKKAFLFSQKTNMDVISKGPNVKCTFYANGKKNVT